MSSEQLSKPATKQMRMISFFASLGIILLFLFVVMIAYIPNRGEAVDREIVAERINTLNELKASEMKEIASYGWVNESKGVVRIPVERAMELYIEEQHRTTMNSSADLSAVDVTMEDATS